ncbi:MAG TPA: glycosyltransferase family 9 protein [Stellaceae bacterium]|nr:glycosyltransferase family 9 protein [Stellaceae bacterium]
MNSLFRDYDIIVRSGLFDPAHYLAMYPDVAARNIDPLMHYLEEGARAGRSPHPDFDAAFYLAQCRAQGHKPENPLLHYLTVGLGLGFKTRPAAGELPGRRGPAAEPQTPVRPAMQLYIDDAGVSSDGVLRVVGWVVCLAPVAAVEVLLDGVSLGPAERGRPRPDIEEIRSDYPNARLSGFLFLGDVTAYGAGARTVTVRATAETGMFREVSRPVDVPEPPPQGPKAEWRIRFHCDHVLLTTGGHLSLSGWAVGAAPATAIDVAIGDTHAGEARLGIERGDVGNLFPRLPHARQSGFSFTRHAGLSLAGEQRITLRVRQADGQVDEIVLPVSAVERVADPETIGPGVPAEHELTVDAPVLIGGRMETPVRGSLEIGGWGLARAGVAAIDIALDSRVLMAAEYGLRRPDVLSAFPDRENSLESGFLALVPHRMLPPGAHKVSVTLRDKAGDATGVDFGIVVEPLPDSSGPWVLRRNMPAAELDLDRRLLARRGVSPFFRVLIAVGPATGLGDVRTTIASLEAQVYDRWRLELLWGRDAGRDRFEREIARLADKGRVISAFAAASLDDTQFLSLVEPGSELGCDAFHEMALAVALRRDADFFYSDERRRDPASGAVEAFFKPQWSPDLLLSTNYIGQLWCARGDLVRRVAASGDIAFDDPYDLVLRLTEAAQAIRHVPAVLSERAAPPIDDGGRHRAALARAARRRGIAAEVRPGIVPGTYRFKRQLAGNGLVSIIIPTRASGGMVARCIETIRAQTAYRHFEIVCIENIPPGEAPWRDWLETNADRVVQGEPAFNWSRFNNRAAAAARGEYLLFLNDDIEIVDPDWLGVLLEHAQREEVGVVGPMLLYPDRRIQHAGMFLAAMAQARHAFRYAAADDPGYFGLAQTERNVIAVTGACLLTRRAVFDRLGGFDEAHDIVNNDLDYCLRVWQAGLSIVYTPHTRLIHHEAASRAGLPDDFDAAAFDRKWRDVFCRGDPFFSPFLAKAQDAVAADDEPNRLVVTGRPALQRDRIKKILVVKLDHLGDCIMAFPAIRRLREHFPESRITVLTSQATRSVWAMEPAVTTTIAFDFFHARSALGELQLTDEDWRGLRDRLVPENFDLAIDLRRHLETRQALRYTGALYVAGIDYRGRFPWLDVAIEWTGDPAFTHKRQHAVDDLINLVDAVAAACEPDRRLIATATPSPSAALADWLAATGGRPFVCIHPAAGNAMKQWPVASFAAVADRLVDEHAVRIVLIGGPGEEAIGEELLRAMRHDAAAVSLIGRFPLSDLPALVTRCVLFVGNDSGPKHIAAGLGVPTVAVQSGSVDVYEWGPVGPHSVAVVRDVTCAPCYLPKAEDCRRGLACLRRLTPDAVYAACEKLLLAASATPDGIG